MKYFDVFEHPVHGLGAIKHGFSWPAFFFPVIWALVKRLWLPALLMSALWLIGVAVLGWIVGSALAVWLLAILIRVFAGFHGNDWRRGHTAKHGFTYAGTEQAHTPDAAVAAVMHKRRKATKSI